MWLQEAVASDYCEENSNIKYIIIIKQDTKDGIYSHIQIEDCFCLRLNFKKENHSYTWLIVSLDSIWKPMSNFLTLAMKNIHQLRI